MCIKLLKRRRKTAVFGVIFPVLRAFEGFKSEGYVIYMLELMTE